MNIALLILSLLPVATEGIPNLPANIKQIIQDVAGSIKAIMASGVTTTVSPSTVLQALAGVIAVLKAEPNVPQDILDLIGALDRAAQAGIAADKAAQQGVDPTTLKPIEPVV